MKNFLSGIISPGLNWKKGVAYKRTNMHCITLFFVWVIKKFEFPLYQPSIWIAQQ